MIYADMSFSFSVSSSFIFCIIIIVAVVSDAAAAAAGSSHPSKTLGMPLSLDDRLTSRASFRASRVARSRASLMFVMLLASAGATPPRGAAGRLA